MGGRVQLYQLLREDTIDLAITASKPKPRLFAFDVIDHERLLLVAGSGLADRLRGREISSELLHELPCIAYDPELPLIRYYFDNVGQYTAPLVRPRQPLEQREAQEKERVSL